MIKLVDDIPAGVPVQARVEAMPEQLIALALRQPNGRIIGVLFPVASATTSDTAGGDSIVSGFVWWCRTADNVRALDSLAARAPSDVSVQPEALVALRGIC